MRAHQSASPLSLFLFGYHIQFFWSFKTQPWRPSHCLMTSASDCFSKFPQRQARNTDVHWCCFRFICFAAEVLIQLRSCFLLISQFRKLSKLLFRCLHRLTCQRFHLRQAQWSRAASRSGISWYLVLLTRRSGFHLDTQVWPQDHRTCDTLKVCRVILLSDQLCTQGHFDLAFSSQLSLSNSEYAL